MENLIFLLFLSFLFLQLNKLRLEAKIEAMIRKSFPADEVKIFFLLDFASDLRDTELVYRRH